MIEWPICTVDDPRPAAVARQYFRPRVPARVDLSPIVLPTTPGGFGVIYADPAWHYRTRTNIIGSRDPQRHYPVMSLADICAMPVKQVAARDCHLFLWVTGTHLPMAFMVMDAWGFKYSAIGFNWVKTKRSNGSQLQFLPDLIDSDFHFGAGFTTRKNTELCLLGRRGSPKRKARDVREVILSPVREHSRKPDDGWQRIMRYADGPYLELFAREEREGWTSWGNEVAKFAGDGK